MSHLQLTESLAIDLPDAFQNSLVPLAAHPGVGHIAHQFFTLQIIKNDEQGSIFYVIRCIKHGLMKYIIIIIIIYYALYSELGTKFFFGI